MEQEPGLVNGGQMQGRHWGPRNSYPVLVARALGYTPENHAISGGSNDAMFRIFKSQFQFEPGARHQYQCRLTDLDIVIACWTGINRSEIWHDQEQQWITLDAGIGRFYRMAPDSVRLQGYPAGPAIANEADYLSYLKSWIRLGTCDSQGRLNKIKNILALNALAAESGVPVINIDSFYSVDRIRWPESLIWPADLDFIRFAEQHNYPRTSWGHYYRAAHAAYADHILDRLKGGSCLGL